MCGGCSKWRRMLDQSLFYPEKISMVGLHFPSTTQETMIVTCIFYIEELKMVLVHSFGFAHFKNI